MPDALPGTEFAEGVLPGADGGEFSDVFWSSRPQVGFEKTMSRKRTNASPRA